MHPTSHAARAHAEARRDGLLAEAQRDRATATLAGSRATHRARGLRPGAIVAAVVAALRPLAAPALAPR